MQVWLDGLFSNIQKMEAGTPQGAVMSPILFNIMLSDIPNLENVEVMSYADDLTIASSGQNVKDVKRLIQRYLELLWNWAKKWGMDINLEKTHLQFYTKRPMSYDLSNYPD